MDPLNVFNLVMVAAILVEVMVLIAVTVFVIILVRWLDLHNCFLGRNG